MTKGYRLTLQLFVHAREKEKQKRMGTGGHPPATVDIRLVVRNCNWIVSHLSVIKWIFWRKKEEALQFLR